MSKEVFLVRVQANARTGSSGQGTDRARHCIIPEVINMTVAVPNTPALYSENQANCGTKEISEDNVAPAPNVTSKAGNAQHTSVLPLVNSDNNDAVLVCFNGSISRFFIV
jgi:hypothetical protein